jgi:integrase
MNTTTPQTRYSFTVEKRTSKKHGVRCRGLVRRNGKVIASQTFDTEQEARSWAEESMFAMRAHRHESTDTRQLLRPLRDLIDAYLDPQEDDEHQGLNALKASSHGQRISQCLWWRDRIGDIRLCDLESSDIKKALREYKAEPCTRYCTRTRKSVAHNRPRSAASRNRMLMTFKAVAAYGIKCDWLKVNPTTGVSNLSENNKRCRMLSHSEETALLDAAERIDPDLWLYIRGLMVSGARDLEWRGMGWRNIDFAEGTAFLATSKNGSARHLALTDDVLAALKNRRQIGGLVFPGRDLAKPRCFRKQWKAALKLAGLDYPRDDPKYVRVHDLRHHAASVLLAAGATLGQIGEVLGHKSAESTKRYSHLEKTTQRDLVAMAQAQRAASHV